MIDRNIARCAGVLDGLENFETVHLRHHQVEEDQVDVILGKQGKTFLAGMRFDRETQPSFFRKRERTETTSGLSSITMTRAMVAPVALLGSSTTLVLPDAIPARPRSLERTFATESDILAPARKQQSRCRFLGANR